MASMSLVGGSSRGVLAWSRRGSVKVGCIAALVVVLLIIVGGAIFVAMNWKGWAADGFRQGATQAVTEAQLPKDQHERIIARISGVADDFKTGKISVDQFVSIMQQIIASPVLPLGMVQLAEAEVVNPSALSDEEKAAGQRALQRFARGVSEQKLVQADIEAVITPISDQPQTQQWDIKPNPTADEVRAFLDKAKAMADSAKIPDEPFTINFADEIDKLVNKALGR
jgi:hypothetical protein